MKFCCYSNLPLTAKQTDPDFGNGSKRCFLVLIQFVPFRNLGRIGNRPSIETNETAFFQQASNSRWLNVILGSNKSTFWDEQSPQKEFLHKQKESNSSFRNSNFRNPKNPSKGTSVFLTTTETTFLARQKSFRLSSNYSKKHRSSAYQTRYWILSTN